jgi:hypothetical protein
MYRLPNTIASNAMNSRAPNRARVCVENRAAARHANNESFDREINAGLQNARARMVRQREVRERVGLVGVLHLSQRGSRSVDGSTDINSMILHECISVGSQKQRWIKTIVYFETDCDFAKPRIPRPVCAATRRTVHRPHIARDQWALQKLDQLAMRMVCWARWKNEAGGGGGRTRP